MGKGDMGRVRSTPRVRSSPSPRAVRSSSAPRMVAPLMAPGAVRSPLLLLRFPLFK